MSWRSIAVLVVLATTMLAGCKKRPTPEQCLDMCWKFNELAFWEKFDAETADMSADEKAKARAEREKVWDEIKERSFDPGLKNCITSCKRGGDLEQVACMEKAADGKTARACFN